MRSDDRNGTIIILNGAPRSGKSSIARIIQEEFSGVWINLGVDAFMQMTPKRYQPGIGLRPGANVPTSNRCCRFCMPLSTNQLRRMPSSG